MNVMYTAFEVVSAKRPLVTLDLTSNSPLLNKEIQGNLKGESSSLSEVTKGFFQATPSFGHWRMSEQICPMCD